MGSTVLVVDDHPGFRRQARVMLEDDGFIVVAEAPDGASAVELALTLQPDVVLLDIQLPDMDGFEVARRLADAGLPAAIVLTSARAAQEFGGRAANTSADAFIAKADLTGARIAAVLTRGA